MKKTIQKEVRFCDKCGKEQDYLVRCKKCGTEMCFQCAKQHGKSYNHAVHFQGSGDGFYCKPCDADLTVSGKDKLHNAYVEIEILKDELEAFNTDFRNRSSKAESTVKILYEKYERTL